MQWRKQVLAATGKTGNNTDGPVLVTDPGALVVGLEFIIEVAGGSPTITYKLQGGWDGTNFDDVELLPSASETAVATFTKTAVGTYIYFVAQKHTRSYAYYQGVGTANTAITYRANLQLGTWQ